MSRLEPKISVPRVIEHDSKYPLLFLLIESIQDFLGDQGGISSGAFVGNEVHLDLRLCSLIHDFCRILNHLLIQHARNHFVKWEGLGIGFLVAHPKRSDKADDCLPTRFEKLRSHLGELLSQRRQPGPVRKDPSHSMLFQDFKHRVHQICFGAPFDVIASVFGDSVEKFVQILSQFGNRNPILHGMVFLLKDDSIQARSKDFNGGFKELLYEYFRIQIVFILNEGTTSPQFPCNDDLRSLKKDQSPFLHLLAAASKDMKILGRVST